MNDDPGTPSGESGEQTVAPSFLRELVQGHELLGDVSDAALDALAGSSAREFVPASTRILTRGGVADAAFLTEHGRVHCGWGLDRPMLGELGRGDVFGLGSVLGERPMSGVALALRRKRFSAASARYSASTTNVFFGASLGRVLLLPW